MPRRPPTPMCPIRVGDACTLCVPGATGPQDCGLVYLVRSDPELREQLAARRSAHAAVRGRATSDLSAPAAAAR
ncbi:DUF6767 domain-containing protein [Thermasporomyces composti]|jgi:hypothetical protein|uniref:Uncharacterized protein n=1 Tax=Thermasporomyces composti TaxID=696763 RepID=A0A3D9V5M1_THECX|nr:DUF6767 domain-containing protein [Thermasporomyces composti]REF36759.1 hypothetical protein DFJ64_2188 [Thermasporomyces composti]